MTTNQKPQAGRPGAGTKVAGYLQDTPSMPIGQVEAALSWRTRLYLIKTLVFQRYADVLLVCAGFVEEAGHAWN